MSEVISISEDPLPISTGAEVIRLYPEGSENITALPEDTIVSSGLSLLIKNGWSKISSFVNEAAVTSPEHANARRRVINRRNSLL